MNLLQKYRWAKISVAATKAAKSSRETADLEKQLILAKETISGQKPGLAEK
jgi:hypothetical protein